MSKQKPLDKNRKDRAEYMKETAFQPIIVEAHTVPTVILLLSSTESPLLLEVLRALNKFCTKSTENRVLVHSLNTMKFLMPLMESHDLGIKRFALRLYAMLCQLPEVPSEVLSDGGFIVQNLFTMLEKSDDKFVQEFSSLILVELSTDLEGCNQIISLPILGLLFLRMRNLDPDVQKNSLQIGNCEGLVVSRSYCSFKIISNLLEDPISANVIVESQLFHWQTIIDCLNSQYIQIQKLVLHVIDQLTCRHKDLALQESFRKTNGLQRLFDMLEIYEWKDLHPIVLNVLKNYTQTRESILHLHATGCLPRLLAFLELVGAPLRAPCLAILNLLSLSDQGRKVLFATNSELKMVEELSNPEGALEEAALGIKNMCAYMLAIRNMMAVDVVNSLLHILKEEYHPWLNLRNNCLGALSELCLNDLGACDRMLEYKGFFFCRTLLKRKGNAEIPIEVLMTCLQLFINMEVGRAKRMLELSYVSEMVDVLKHPDVRVRILACQGLFGLMCEAGAPEMFARVGVPATSACLRQPALALKAAACRLVAASATSVVTRLYIAHGTMHYMVQERRVRISCPEWDAALSALFSAHPSAKFAYTGRLEVNEPSGEAFYAQRRLQPIFPLLEKLLDEITSPRYPIYLCCFPGDEYAPANDEVDAGPMNIGGFQSQMGTLNQSDLNIPRTFSLAYLRADIFQKSVAANDTNLSEYLKKLRKSIGDGYSLPSEEIYQKLGDTRYKGRINTVSSALAGRVEALAQFVCNQLSGPDPAQKCNVHILELHLNEIKREMETNVIPLGRIRVGGRLERSLLMKVLADRLRIPIALVRGSQGYAWCEAALPEPPEKLIRSGGDSNIGEVIVYPSHLLRPNYVVDLLDQPGRLMPLGSSAADEYCGRPLVRRYVTVPPPIGSLCLCEPPLKDQHDTKKFGKAEIASRECKSTPSLGFKK